MRLTLPVHAAQRPSAGVADEIVLHEGNVHARRAPVSRLPALREAAARIRVNDALQKQDARQTECRHMKLCRHDFPFRFRPAALTKTGVHSQREDARSGSEQACP
jgi:hypothetical protein